MHFMWTLFLFILTLKKKTEQKQALNERKNAGSRNSAQCGQSPLQFEVNALEPRCLS